MPLLLDETGLSGATGAYGLRKLRAAYAGSALRVKRTSDNTEQDIGFAGNDLDTSALTSFVGAANGIVTKLYDQSGNARDLVIPTSGHEPTLVSSGSIVTGSNSKPAMDFTGHSLAYGTLDDFVNVGTCTIWTVFNADTISTSSATGYQNVGLGGDLSGYWGIMLSNYPAASRVGVYSYAGTDTDLRIPISIGSWYLFEHRHEAGNNYISTNGGADSSVSSGNISNLAGAFRLGFMYGGYCDAKIHEFVTYDTALSATDRITGRANINGHYSLYSGGQALTKAVADSLSLAELVTPILTADTRPVYFGSASVPADGAAATNATTTLTITPPASMLAGDLVAVICQSRVSGTWSVGVTGGQTWTSETAFTTTNVFGRIFWCQFNGTWAASPRFDCTIGTCTTAVMHVFRPATTSYVWTIDVAQASTTFAAPSTPFTVTRTGLTTSAANVVTLATWTTPDDCSWTSLTGTGWGVTGTAQYRNTASTDQSLSFAHHIDAPASSVVPNVSKNQTTVTAVAGITVIIAWDAAPGALTKSLSDAITMTELRGGAAVYQRSQSDPMAVNELLAKVATYLRSLADPSLILTEVFDKILTPGGAALTKSLSDSVTLTELLAKIATLQRSLADPLAITEVLAKSLAFSRSLTDPLTTTENIAVVRALMRSFIDPLNVGENPVAIKLLIKAFADALILGEAIGKQLIMAAYSDTVTRADSDTPGASWNENVTGVAVVGNALQFVNTGAYSSVVWTQPVAVSCQYQKATVTWTAGHINLVGMLFRCSNTTNGSCYRVDFDTGNDLVNWENVPNMTAPGTSTAIGQASMAIAPGNTLGITCELTGTNTVLRVWLNPTGLPTRADNWNGDTTPNVTMTQNPATPRDTGTFLGLSGAPLESGADLKWDNWFGGGCLESTGVLWSQNLFDNLLVSETLGKVASLQRYASDPIILSELFGKAAALQRAVIDPFSITETFAQTRGLARSYFDTLTLGEALAKQASKKFTDAVALTEAFAKQLILARALLDPITIGEAVTKQPQLRRTDTITITEAFAKQLQLGRSLSDTITLAELVTKFVGAKNLVDPIALTEALAKQINRPLSDLMTLGEALRKDVGKKLSDMLTLNEALVKAIGKGISDPIVLTELVGKLKQISKSLSDAITINEAISKIFVGIKNVSDPLTMSEALSKQLQRKLTDTLVIFGSLENAVQLKRAHVDPLVLTDLLAMVRDWRRSVSDTITITEAIQKILVLVRSISNPITLLEALAKSVNFVRARSDTLTITEAIAKSIGYAKALPDSMTLIEALATSATFRRSISDLMTMTDAGTRQVLRKLLSESLTMSELVVALKITNLFKAISDPLTMTDSVGKLFILLRTFSDLLSFTERAISKASAFHRLRSDPIALNEALGKSAAYLRPFVDLLGLDDLLSRIAVYRRSASDPLTLAEALEAARLLVQSRSDAITLSDVVDTTMVIGTLATDRGQHRLIHGRVFSRVN